MSRGRVAILLAVLIIGAAIGVLLVRKPSDPVEPKVLDGAPGPEVMTAPAVSGGPAQRTVPSPSLIPEEQKKWVVLEQILESKNDNDPRIDTDLRHLSPGFKSALAIHYAELKPERFNERGTLVFLVGRELVHPADVDFMRTVLTEKPCLSVSDCSRPPAAHAGEDDHREMMNETTTRYPQLMALRALKQKWRELQKDPTGQTDLIRQIRETLEEASRSPDPRIADEAKAILKSIPDSN
jgi:hypothetical protein